MDEPLDDEVRIPDKLFFRIGELSDLVGVEPHVLRYWEQEFRIRPQRSPSGQRMYRRHDIARFLRIKNLLYKQKFTIAGARRALQESRQGSESSIAADVGQLRAARRRLSDVREQVAEIRTRLGAAWDAHLGSSSG